METQLHQQLKQWYADGEQECELPLGRFRVDVVRGEELIEIQCSPLAALRDKARELTPARQLRIVKPIARHTYVIRKKWTRIVSQGLAEEVGDWCDLFEELVHFVKVFPRPNLLLEAVLVDVREVRRPPRRGRRWGYRIEQRELTEVLGSRTLSSADDLFQLLPEELPTEFHTGHLAELLKRPRWFAQKVAYCLRETAAATVVGKQGNTLLYTRTSTGKPQAKSA